MKLLIYGHWSHTGFGIVTEALGTRLVNAGVDVRVLALNHRGEPVKGPLANRVYPLDFLRQHVANLSAAAITGTLWETLDSEDKWKPDAVLAIADVSGLLTYMGADMATWNTLPVYHYCPIEGDNLPPLWKHLWATIHPVAMSDYGARVISGLIDQPVPMIYHGVDTEAFFPVSPGKPIRFDGKTLRSKEDCKVNFGMDPARKYILRADRNVIRKNYDALFRAFALIAERDPDVDLVLHCRVSEPEGSDLRQEVARMPEALRDRVLFTQAHDTFRGLPQAGLNALYNSADVYVSTTGGEGFGLTLAESLAAGVPVVCTEWAAEKEVVGDGGILIPPLHDSYGDIVRFHSSYGMDWAVPDPRAFVEPVLNLLSRASWRRDLGQAGRLHVKRSFSWDEAATSFLTLFETPLEAVA